MRHLLALRLCVLALGSARAQEEYDRARNPDAAWRDGIAPVTSPARIGPSRHIPEFLPEDTLDRLDEIVNHVRFADHVFDAWDFGGRFPYGKALAVLFSVPPGTGKTMAAGIIAQEGGLDLCRVDLSQVVAKWIGETEQTLSRFVPALAVRAVAPGGRSRKCRSKRPRIRWGRVSGSPPERSASRPWGVGAM